MEYLIKRIPKISAGKPVGIRIIEEPNPTLKNIQRSLIQEIIKEFKLPAYLHGVTGTNTLSNSSPHVGKSCLFKIDLKDYFHTVTIQKLERSITNIDLLNKIRQYCIYKDRLPTGAPTSPILAIIAFLNTDKQILEVIKNTDIKYTRYMDDLSFSSNSLNELNYQLIKQIKEIIIANGFLINQKKSGLSLDWNRKIVTGVIVNHHANIPLEFRLLLRAKLDHIARDFKELTQEVNGDLSYIRSINPNLYNKFMNYFEKRQKFYNDFNK